MRLWGFDACSSSIGAAGDVGVGVGLGRAFLLKMRLRGFRLG
ncbi:hypothetical protein BRCON_2198 [Candidatus Sumerlaea chitinivorans]|uniref:Uncharacterized protein n=1 Tax=Sumerlaea chitinivorans TaxID=2250252 RepID=A0A2Z4Y991_SUMC1|nr:hypothetical protein BRCON_2198 [Candidatus Sumerlaea chitinivorans]